MEAGIEGGTEAGIEGGTEAGIEWDIGAGMGSAEGGRTESKEGAEVVFGMGKGEVGEGEIGLEKADVKSVMGSVEVCGSTVGVATKGKGSR